MYMCVGVTVDLHVYTCLQCLLSILCMYVTVYINVKISEAVFIAGNVE